MVRCQCQQLRLRSTWHASTPLSLVIQSKGAEGEEGKLRKHSNGVGGMFAIQLCGGDM